MSGNENIATDKNKKPRNGRKNFIKEERKDGEYKSEIKFQNETYIYVETLIIIII